MCIKCTFIKWEHSDYNFCPYCGERIKGTFVPNVKDMTLSTNSPHTIKKKKVTLYDFKRKIYHRKYKTILL